MEELPSGFRDQGTDGPQISVVDELPHRAGADGCAVLRGPGDLHKPNPLLGQLLSHHSVVEAGDLAAGLLPGVPGGDIQGLGDLAEQGQVQTGVALDHCPLILQEVAGEGGRADEVGPALVADHMGQVGHPLRHQLPPHGKGHQAGVLLQHEQVDGGKLRRRPLHQGQVAQGEGVGVHDNGSGWIFRTALGQTGAEAGKAVFPVL